MTEPSPTARPQATQSNAAANASEKSDANMLLGTGVGVGAYGTAMAATTGFICPACIVVAPALIGAGLYKRHKRKKASEGAAE